MKLIYGYLPVHIEKDLSILGDYASILDEYKGDYEKTLNKIESDGFKYFRSYSPMFFQWWDDTRVLEDVLIWSKRKQELLQFKDSPAFQGNPSLVLKLKVMQAGEALVDTIFDWSHDA